MSSGTTGSQDTAGSHESTGSRSAVSTEQSIPESRGAEPGTRRSDSPGRTSVAASVVEKITGVTAGEISGVHAMGGGVSRAFGTIRERIPGGGTASTTGVQVEVGERQAAIDLDLVVEYGASILDIAHAVRRNVISGVERMTGLEVIEVNIAVNDIHLPSDDERQDEASSRVE